MSQLDTASTLVRVGIPALAIAVLALIGWGVWSAAPPSRRRRHLAIYALGAITWLGFSGALAGSGLLARFEARPPPMLLLLVPTIALPVALGLSRFGAHLAHAVPLAALVAFHSFRLPLELVMHEAAREGTMPVQMTFTGANFDIVTGASALVVALLIMLGRAPRWLVIAWNALGSALLVTIVIIALASLPQVHAFGSSPERLNTWVATFPFQWLPAVLVASALLGHIVLWRRLLRPARPRLHA